MQDQVKRTRQELSNQADDIVTTIISSSKFMHYWRLLTNHNWFWPYADTNHQYFKHKKKEERLKEIAESENHIYLEAYRLWDARRLRLMQGVHCNGIDIGEFRKRAQSITLTKLLHEK